MRASLFVATLLVLCALFSGAHCSYGLSGVLRLQDYTKISHDTYYLSRKRHPHNPDKFVHGYAFLNLHRSTRAHLASKNSIHRDKHHHFHRSLATHESHGSQTNKKLYQNLPSCTGPIADGASWKMSRGFYLHTKNQNGLTSQFIVDAVAKANDAWDCGLSEFEKLIDGPLLGVIDGTSGTAINLDEPDGRNEIGFASIEGHPGTVAVTIVWGIFDGPIYDRQLIEFDMIFDGQHYTFGDASKNKNVMDLQAIATHEMGHRNGLDDIYDPLCDDVTMYGTSSEGEIIKRSLTRRDLDGLSLLYGPLAPTK